MQIMALAREVRQLEATQELPQAEPPRGAQASWWPTSQEVDAALRFCRNVVEPVSLQLLELVRGIRPCCHTGRSVVIRTVASTGVPSETIVEERDSVLLSL